MQLNSSGPLQPRDARRIEVSETGRNGFGTRRARVCSCGAGTSIIQAAL